MSDEATVREALANVRAGDGLLDDDADAAIAAFKRLVQQGAAAKEVVRLADVAMQRSALNIANGDFCVPNDAAMALRAAIAALSSASVVDE